jgi:putative Mg2+ transporter-C (MgtC) family protein
MPRGMSGMVTMDWQAILFRLGFALALGSLIGFERQWRQKMAGLRTNALVALGAAGFVVFSSLYPTEGSPTRMAAQIVSGIGFLGAGVIMRDGFNVQGLNTAATLWCSAMVGTFAGGGYLAASGIAAGFVVLTNMVLRPLVRMINRQSSPAASEVETHYTVSVTCRAAEEAHIRSLLLHSLSGAGLGLRRIDSEDVAETIKVIVTAQAVSPAPKHAALEQIVGRLSLEPYVSAARWLVERQVADA